MLATALPNTRGDSRIYRHFLSSAVQCVRDSAPKFGQFCQMYRLPISTDTLIEEVLRVDQTAMPFVTVPQCTIGLD